MNDKARLQEIKSYFAKIIDEKINVNPHLNADDISFLIGQAERVQELVKENDFFEKAHHTNLKIARYEQEHNRELQKQNNCYREALEFYAKKSNYIHTIKGSNILLERSQVDRDDGDKARQVLEGSEC